MSFYVMRRKSKSVSIIIIASGRLRHVCIVHCHFGCAELHSSNQRVSLLVDWKIDLHMQLSNSWQVLSPSLSMTFTSCISTFADADPYRSKHFTTDYPDR